MPRQRVFSASSRPHLFVHFDALWSLWSLVEGLHEGRESLAEVRRQFGILSDLHFCWERVCIARYIEEELNVVEVNFRADAEVDTIPLLLDKMPLRIGERYGKDSE